MKTARISRIWWKITLLIIIFSFNFPAYAQYSGGTGEPNDPFLIYTAEQMNTIGAEPNDWDKHFKLMADIDLVGYTATTFNVIGRIALYRASGDIPFSGAFDGNGHTISNFNYTGISGGIFGWVEGAEIKNLRLIDPNIHAMLGGIRIGSLVGYLYDATVDNCHVVGGVVGGQVTGGFRVGGLVGENYYGTITDCSFKGSVSNASGLGGLVGWNRGTIKNCYFSGDVSGEGQEVGGLVGFNTDTINNCEASANVSGTRKVGGLVGKQKGGHITDCYTTGTVSGLDEVGGFIGGNNGTIANCYTVADVSGATYVGGFTGQNGLNLSDVVSRGRISNCYARGNVIGEENVGGLVGYNYRFGTINNCYSTGVVSGAIEAGGLIGQNRNGDVFNSFWDIETSSQIISAAGVGKTTEQMQDPNMYISSGWIYTEKPDGPHYDWAEPVGGGYPILWWQLSAPPELPIFSGGTGEPNDPYLITTAEELNTIGHNSRLMDAHFRLVTDIDLLNVNFFMIGNDSFPFSGVFDGNGKRIFNFSHTIQESSQSYLDENSEGFFKCVSSGEIKKLGIIDPNIDSSQSDWLGTLICWLRGGSVISCYVQGGSISGSGCVGGLVANNRSGTITDCHTAMSIVGGRSVGGLVGDHIGDVSDCYSTSNILGVNKAGGLVGRNSGQIFNCYSTGNVSASNNNVGGLAGINEIEGKIIYCYASGDVTGQHTIGGLVGYNKGWSTMHHAIISNCYATGSITGVDNVGGLVAHNRDGVIRNCYSKSYASGSDNVGGLVGRLGPGEVSRCYSTGMVSGTTDTGGLVGVQEGGSVFFSFWDIQTSQQSSSFGGTGKTTAEMEMVITFLEAGWDFVDETDNGIEDIWWVLEGQDYPRLSWEAHD